MRAIAPATPRAWAFVAAGGLVAAALDIVYAWLFWKLKAGVTMERILQSVAAGLLGDASRAGGSATAVLGLALHSLIALTMSTTYYLTARRWMVLAARPLLYGAAYGLALYVVMNHIVIPLSAASRGSSDPLWVTLTITVHVLFVGIPIAIATKRALTDIAVTT